MLHQRQKMFAENVNYPLIYDQNFIINSSLHIKLYTGLWFMRFKPVLHREIS